MLLEGKHCDYNNWAENTKASYLFYFLIPNSCSEMDTVYLRENRGVEGVFMFVFFFPLLVFILCYGCIDLYVYTCNH